MKVKELIEQLKKYDGNTKVMLDIDDNWDNHSREIADIYEDYLVDANGRSYSDRCVADISALFLFPKK